MRDEELIDLTSVSDEDILNAWKSQIKVKSGYYLPDIETFVRDPHYLGMEKIYPFWLEKLKILYPTPYTTSYTQVAVKGGIGIGKTTFSNVVLLYDMARILLLENPKDYYGIESQFGYTFRFLKDTKGEAEALLQGIKEQMNESPFFQEMKKRYPKDYKRIDLAPGRGQRQLISRDLVSIVVTEINFWEDQEVVSTLIQDIASRMDSRFISRYGYNNHLVLDSSDTSPDSIMEYMIRNPSYNFLVFHAPIWEAKRGTDQDIYFRSGSFEVYTGDSVHPPFIIDSSKGHILNNKMDEDRVLTVPEELRDRYNDNIVKALQETAGVSVFSQGKFLSNELIDRVCTLDVPYEEHLSVPFNDSTPLMTRRIKELIESLPSDRYLYARIDLGLVTDNAGFSLGYVEDYYFKIDNTENNDLSKSVRLKVPLTLSIGREKGEETSIKKLIEFILEIHKLRPLYSVTTDQFQSSAIRQELSLQNIKSELLSVDRTDQPYVLFKTLMSEGRIDLPNHEGLKKELRELQRVGNKIDHPKFKKTKDGGSGGTKDISDSVCGLIEDMYKTGVESLTRPREDKKYHQGTTLNIWRTLNKDTYQKQLRMKQMRH